MRVTLRCINCIKQEQQLCMEYQQEILFENNVELKKVIIGYKIPFKPKSHK